MTDLKIFAKSIEPEALDQVMTLLRQEAFQHCKVRIMPDVHVGKGCVIGFTADLGDKVIPNIVGVDIGCGMLTIALDRAEINFAALDRLIREKIPFGRNVHKKPSTSFDALKELHCLSALKERDRFEKSIGTLGGGNHFIEVDEDEEGNYYLIIHTGSRNLGKQVADYYQKKAIERLQDKNALPRELCYLEGDDREAYLHDMLLCQCFASVNRAAIAEVIMHHFSFKEVRRFETIHNYIDLTDNIVRKGAISAKEGELLLIPINMRDGCILGVGRGNTDCNNSLSFALIAPLRTMLSVRSI